MPRIVMKCHYIKGGSQRSRAYLNNAVNYIATREGAEPILQEQQKLPATEKQCELIGQLLNDYPLCRGMPEFEDYLKEPTVSKASEFISQAIDENCDSIAKMQNYVQYIATRPHAQHIGKSALFSYSDAPLVLSHVANEVSEHDGNIWLPIISMRREDADRLGYNDARNWQALLRANTETIAEAMKIPINDLRWYAAFHNEGSHPHVHMICYSADPSKGYLTESGIDIIKVTLAKQMFRHELTEIYQKETEYRDDIAHSAVEKMDLLIDHMKSGNLQNIRIEALMLYLSEKLTSVKGKRQYGYLQAPLKSVVDEIVCELEKDPRIAEAYDLWYEQRENVLRTYRDEMPERMSLSKQKEFKRIKNIIIEEALKLAGEANIVQKDGLIEQRLEEAKHTDPESDPTGTASEKPTPSTKESSTVGSCYQSIASSSTALLHHMGRIFQNQRPQLLPQNGYIVDKKLRRKMLGKRLTMGQRIDDHKDIKLEQ